MFSICFCSEAWTQSQGTQFYPWSSANRLANRMEIKTADNFLTLSGSSQRYQRSVLELADSIMRSGGGQNEFTAVDIALMQRMLNRFGKDHAGDGRKGFASRGMMKSENDGFRFELNPVLGLQFGSEKTDDGSESVFFQSAGATASGELNGKFSFQVFGAGIREKVPQSIQQYFIDHRVIPGAGDVNYKDKVASYFDFRGNVAAQITPYIRAEFGYGRHFLGNGYRSLYLSDFSPSQLYGKLDTRIWRLNYTNYFSRLAPSYNPDQNKRFDNKYSVMHRLSMNVLPWLQFGIFESIIFSRGGGYDLSYLQPVIFLRSIEQQNGSPDNANLGGDFKITIQKQAQIYGTLLLDEFLKDEVFGGRQWWGNKQGIQLGGKWVDAFGLPNFDLQAEVNNVRPFMYQFRSPLGAYTHYHQPLAHPLGANFREFVGILNYRPHKNWNVFARINYWNQGTDSLSLNFGLDPNVSYNSRIRQHHYPMFAGGKQTGVNGALTISYEPFQDAMIDLSVAGRRNEPVGVTASNSMMVSLGLRLNMYRRDFDF